ncbi:hypothetical protein BGZ76_009640, partial [Entomortierella beljakovae]
MSDSSLTPTNSGMDISPVQDDVNKYDVTDSMRLTSMGSSEDADNHEAVPRSPSTDSAVDQFRGQIMRWTQEISEIEKAMFKEQDPYLREHYAACIKRREDWIMNEWPKTKNHPPNLSANYVKIRDPEINPLEPNDDVASWSEYFEEHIQS